MKNTLFQKAIVTPLIFMFIMITGISCGQSGKKSAKKNPIAPVQVPNTKEGYKTAYFASGCFWCSQSIFKSVIGVKKVIAGYAGGHGESPNYHDYSRMGYAETVAVLYDPKIIDFATLLTVYFGSQNPVQQNGQGPDRGSGYRSIIFYQNETQKKEAKKKIAALQKSYNRTIAAEVMPFQKFWQAEAYHQNFEEKHPNNPYIKQVSIPRLRHFERQYPKLLKKNKD